MIFFKEFRLNQRKNYKISHLYTRSMFTYTVAKIQKIHVNLNMTYRNFTNFRVIKIKENAKENYLPHIQKHSILIQKDEFENCDIKVFESPAIFTHSRDLLTSAVINRPDLKGQPFTQCLNIPENPIYIAREHSRISLEGENYLKSDINYIRVNLVLSYQSYYFFYKHMCHKLLKEPDCTEWNFLNFKKAHSIIEPLFIQSLNHSKVQSIITDQKKRDYILYEKIKEALKFNEEAAKNTALTLYNPKPNLKDSKNLSITSNKSNCNDNTDL